MVFNLFLRRLHLPLFCSSASHTATPLLLFAMLRALLVLALLAPTEQARRVRNVPGLHLRANAMNRVSIPHFDTWNGIGPLGEDPLAQVRSIIDMYDRHDRLRAGAKELGAGAAAGGGDDATTSLLEVSQGVAAGAGAGAGAGGGKVHAFCEICILIMQMKERGQPHLCAGLNPDYFISVSWRCVLFSCLQYVCVCVGGEGSLREEGGKALCCLFARSSSAGHAARHRWVGDRGCRARGGGREGGPLGSALNDPFFHPTQPLPLRYRSCFVPCGVLPPPPSPHTDHTPTATALRGRPA